MAATPGATGQERVTPAQWPARAAAIVSGVFWGVLFFGIIDLTVVIDQDERFYAHYLLETGWGLLFTVLVMVPLLLWAWRPGFDVLLEQQLAVGAVVLVAALPTLTIGQWVVGAALGLLPLGIAAAAGRPRPFPDVRRVGDAHPFLLGLALVAVVASVVHAVAMVGAARSGAEDDITWGLPHLPMQAGFGLAVAVSALVAVLAGATDAPGWRLSLLPAAMSAVWLGAVSVLYPDHLGSLGTVGGGLSIAWGAAFAVAALLVSPGGARRR